ncbi:hypothetical protein HNY73_020657 [Argiope bruennichi]|uniref:Uncharacterized protein n=1 Tax=Argiope bruennichi TaxID=94029 RepID=A0A8T0E8M1_ARGBR|nr:hypothetical protein HNY73_020657 [Argiope bruennichi]
MHLTTSYHLTKPSATFKGRVSPGWADKLSQQGQDQKNGSIPCMKFTAVQILTTTPITSENPSHPLHGKTSARPGNSNNQRSASSSSETPLVRIAMTIPAPTQPKPTIPAQNPAKSAPHQSNRIQLTYPMQPTAA